MNLDKDDRIGGPTGPGRDYSASVTLVFCLLIAGTVWYFYGKEITDTFNEARHRTGQPSLAQIQYSRFQAVYERLHMQPLTDDLAYRADVIAALEEIKREPCDKRAIYKLEQSLLRANARRDAANALVSFAAECGNSDGDLEAAANIYYDLGDYARAIEIADQLIKRDPHYANIRYVRGKALKNLGRFDEALGEYISTIELYGDPKNLASSVFTELAQVYSSLGRHCEAMTSIQTYVSLEPGKRDTSQTRRMISDYAGRGRCNARYASGTEVFPRMDNGVVRVRAEINGTAGWFILDTGASLVAVTDSFAKRANLDLSQSQEVHTQTANGASTGTLASASVVRVGHLEASAVALVVVPRMSLGDGTDGLLGMSFLARFRVVIGEREIRVQRKSRR